MENFLCFTKFVGSSNGIEQQTRLFFLNAIGPAFHFLVARNKKLKYRNLTICYKTHSPASEVSLNDTMQ